MEPSLIFFAGHPIHAYGIFLTLGHLAGFAALLWLARRRGLALEPFVDLAFLVLVAALFGGRLWYVISFPNEFAEPKEWLYFWRGGLSVLGSLACAIPVYLLFLRQKKMPLWETSDLIVPALPLALGLFRLGCFTAGCCYGRPTQAPWGVPSHSPLLPEGLRGALLHPTQAYEAIFLFSASAILFFLARRPSPRGGAAATGFFLAYGLYRLATNHLRADLQPTTAALAALGMSAVALPIFLWRLRLQRKK